jgi:pimeloyl-ACP methyl ester carboxylesterase
LSSDIPLSFDTSSQSSSRSSSPDGSHNGSLSGSPDGSKTASSSEAISAAEGQAFFEAPYAAGSGVEVGYTYPVSAVQFLAPKPIQNSKPLFVFLPGMDGTGTLLRPQIDRLAPWFDLRCVAISPQDTTGWEPLARQVSRLVSAEVESAVRLGQRRRSVYLCGESFGGCLAMQVLTRFPHLFDRVILVNPASSFRRLPWMHFGSLLTRQLPALAYRYSALGLAPFLMDPFRVARRDREALEAAMGSVPVKTAAWRMGLLSRFEVERLPLERMTHPVLLIAGESDRLLPSKREAQSLQARFPNAQLTLLPHSGHACLLERDTNLQKILRQHGFLES